MKKFISILVLLVCLASYGQTDERHERIKALKVPFITEELELTPAEAEKFWPIYNSYDKRMHDLRERERELFKEKFSRSGSKNKLSESQAQNLIEKYNALQKEKYQVEREMLKDLTQKLPASKMVFLPEVERNFGRKLWEEYKKRKNN
ncbi:hypothetical protein [Leeuwenhoekiella nanhaiensis]|uniref:Sensor of ECF-type sigma factor n=1 Tax=Leeuwenhoekiella nanhaiensis TaxID=1655491 RepID=A0A2G1VR80_9FLAO|nr:hypothetical protein [Leeuwenhoekiella nanhaiensis]PHQ28959.1 hypothetical protein CJ305_12265 [Leeuwenhoekiella nanhaiensis]